MTTRRRPPKATPGTRKPSPGATGGTIPIWVATVLIDVAGETESRRALQKILRAACSLEGIDGGGIYLLDRARNGLILQSSWGLGRAFTRAMGFVPLTDRRVRILARGQAYFGTVEESVQPGAMAREGLCAFGSIPVRRQGETVATLNVGSRTPGPIPPPVRHALAALASALGGIFARMEHEAATRASARQKQLLVRHALRMSGDQRASGRPLRALLRDVGRQCEAEACLFAVPADDGRSLVLCGAWQRAGTPARPDALILTARLKRRLLEGSPLRLLSRHRTSPFRAWIEAGVLLPIVVSGNLAGLLILAVPKPNSLPEAGLVFANIAGTLAASTLARESMQQHLRRQFETEATLSKVSSQLIHALSDGSIDRAIRKALGIVGAFNRADRASLYLYEDDFTSARCISRWVDRAAHGARTDLIVSVPIATMPETSRKIMDGRTVLIEDTEAMPVKHKNEQKTYMRYGVRAMGLLPLKQHSRVLGFVAFVSSKPRAWDRQHLHLSTVVADMIATVLSHAEANRALQESEHRYRTVLEQAADAVVLFDPDDRIIDANPQACRYVGMAREEVLGRTPADLLTPDGLAQLAQVRRNMRPGIIRQVTLEIRRADGSTFMADVKGRILPDGRQLVIYRDITDRLHMEHEILRIAAREQQRIGHDLHDTLGQELTGILYLFRSLRRGVDRHGSLDAAEATRLERLLQQALDHTRSIARGLVKLQVTSEALPGLLTLLCRDMEVHPGITCNSTARVQAPLADPTAPQQLYHIAQEAVSNAVRHGRPSRIAVGLDVTAREGVLQIDDNGTGLKPGTRRRKTGMGMGLRVMRYRAEVIGGRLILDTPPGGGTRVTCIVPNRPPRDTTG